MTVTRTRLVGLVGLAVLFAVGIGFLAGLPATESKANIELRLVAEGFNSPVHLVSPPDGSGRRFVVDRVGVVYVITADGRLLDEPFLDLRADLVPLHANFDERGLLGLAFHPDFASNQRFYVYYSAPRRSMAPANWDHTAHVSEFTVSADNPNRANADSERVILQIDQPQFNHNAGALAFGPDGYLYIAVGDGGGSGDQGVGHSPMGNAQDINMLLGKILRIDVGGGRGIDGVGGGTGVNGGRHADGINGGTRTDRVSGGRGPNAVRGGTGTDGVSGGIGNHGSTGVNGDHVADRGDGARASYSIPADNPFVGKEGRDEIYAWGFRNPFRMAFDRGGQHELFVADVGQNLWEEVNIVAEPGNYGWRIKEGTHWFDPARPNAIITEGPSVGPRGEPLIDPIIEYRNRKLPGARGPGISIIGGYVYRGSALPELHGHYVFADWSQSFRQGSGVLMTAERPSVPGEMWSWQVVLEPDAFILGMGEDDDGELYVLTSDEAGPVGQTGKVFQLVPASR